MDRELFGLNRFVKFCLWPTYGMYLIVNCFCKRHPLYRSNYSYQDWCYGSTDTCRFLGMALTMSLWAAFVVVVVLAQKFLSA